jgi:UDP-N-acetylmuramoylalanine--D-glutamate ligase
VLGAGASGVAAARLLAREGARVTVADAAARRALTAAAGTLGGVAALRAGLRDLPDGSFDLAVVSPGFAPTHPWRRACRARRIPMVGELELGFSRWPGRVLAVTGSKGKSSLVKLCAECLERAGAPAAPAGNYGLPLSALALDRPGLAWAVVEVSSFQLETVRAFRPDVAVLLNVQADHLDRHRGLAAYRALKLRLFARQRPGDAALLPEGFVAGRAVPRGVRRERFGAGPDATWRYSPGAVRGPFAGGVRRLDLRGSWFDNPVLGLAAAAAAGALTRCGAGPDAIAAGLRAFVPLPHRLQAVAERAGVRYVDDSKATSLSALAAALRMLPPPLRLIAGGRLKETVLDGPKELLTARVRKVYLIGESAQTLYAAWSSAVVCETCGTLEAAVSRAVEEAVAGEQVVLSPGCASFDQFVNYGQRGDRFQQAVRQCIAAVPRGRSRRSRKQP